MTDNRTVKNLIEDIELILREDASAEDIAKFVISKQIQVLEDVRDEGYGLYENISSLNNQLYILNE